MSDVDPYNVTYPDVEERMSLDIFPGLMFCFRNNVKKYLVFTRAQLDTVWMIVHVDVSGQAERYLLLGSTGVLRWHDGELGRIKRIIDPVCEAPWRREAREKELAMLLDDTTCALGA